MMKKIILLLLALAMAVGSAACGGAVEQPVATVDAQGVEDTILYIGVTGDEAFCAGLEGALLAYNSAGGFYGREIVPVYADEDRSGIKEMVEKGDVFAVVLCPGTDAARTAYFESVGIPVITADRTHRSDGLRSYPVRPTYAGEGRALMARALASGVGLGGTKVGVVATNDEMGAGLLRGICDQADEIGAAVVCREVDPSGDPADALSALQTQGCDVVILAMGQTPLAAALEAMESIDFEAKVLTSYSNGLYLSELPLPGCAASDRRPVFVSGWVDTSTEAGLKEYYMFMYDMMAWESENGIDSTDYTQTYMLDPPTITGYAAGALFLHGLKQVTERGDCLTWESYAAAMEAAPVHIPIGGNIDFADGSRLGNTALALYRLSPEPDAVTGGHDPEIVSPILSLPQVLDEVN